MKLFDRIFNKSVTPVKKSLRYSSNIKRSAEDRVKMEMDTLSSAVEDALDTDNPNRVDLLTIYGKSWKDAQVISEREKAESFVTVEPYELCDNSNAPNEDARKLFQRPWFEHYLKYKLYEEFWGYTLLEFQQLDENGEFEDVMVFPRKNVKPFHKLIVAKPDDNEGISYQDAFYDYFLIELGNPEDLGKLETISREVILKNYSRSDWSEYNERFGKPILDYGINTDNEDEIREKEEMAKNFGSNLYLIRDVDEEITIHEFSSHSAGENFENSARFCDEQIAKLMNGQVGTGDEKAFVGSAEVHERILNSFNKARLLRIQNSVNYELIPFLIHHGYQLDGLTFVFPILEKKNDKQIPTAPEQSSGKKKINTSGLGFEYAGILISLNILSQGKSIEFKQNIADNLARRLFNGKKPIVDARVFDFEYKQMQRALKSGWGKGFNVEFGKPDWEFIQNLKYNTAVFNAFKCNNQIKETARLLVDDRGNAVSWKEFKQSCNLVSEKYNQRWLRTEFNTAETSALFARKWQEYQQDKDLYPSLKHVCVMDGGTRPTHAILNGLIAPIDSEHWKKYYPPLDFGCRCGVEQTDEDVIKPSSLPDIPEMFQHNVGMTAQVFNESHPFYSGMNEKEKANALYFVQQNIRPAKDVIAKNKEFNEYGNEYDKSYFNADNGGYTVIHKQHNKKSGNFKGEKETFNAFANRGSATALSDESGNKAKCDGVIDGIASEVKVMDGYRNLHARAVKAKKQGARQVIFNIKFDNDREMFKRFNTIKKDTELDIWYLKDGRLGKWI